MTKQGRQEVGVGWEEDWRQIGNEREECNDGGSDDVGAEKKLTKRQGSQRIINAQIERSEEKGEKDFQKDVGEKTWRHFSYVCRA